MTFRTGHHQNDRGASLPVRLLFLLIAAFAILHLPLGHSEPLRQSQHPSDWSGSRIRTADHPVHYSVQEHGRGRIAMLEETRRFQKDQAPGDAHKAVAQVHAEPPMRHAAVVPERTTERRIDRPRQTASFLARAPPLPA